MYRIRIQYSKGDQLRYTSTQDIQKVWERVLRRARLPIAYSKGFHPQPKIQIACPLPLGMLSQAEYVDFWLEREDAPDDLQRQIEAVLNEGITIKSIQEIPTSDPALQSRIDSVEYLVEIRHPDQWEGLDQKIESLLSNEQIIRERRGKAYDLRPLIETCEIINTETKNNKLIMMKLSARPGATGRPEEVLLEMNIDPNTTLITRQSIYFPG
jgi:radical SAM-linked protein